MLTPYGCHAPAQPGVTFKEAVDEKLEQPPEGVRQTRRVPITQDDLNEFGYTQGCQRCDHSLRYGYGRTIMAHSEACRPRSYAKLKRTVKGRARIEHMERRPNEAISDEIERQHGEAAEEGPLSKGGG